MQCGQPRERVYLVASGGLAPSGNSDEDLREFLRGKRVVAGRHGGTPNLLPVICSSKPGKPDPIAMSRCLSRPMRRLWLRMLQQDAGDIETAASRQISEGISLPVFRANRL